MFCLVVPSLYFYSALFCYVLQGGLDSVAVFSRLLAKSLSDRLYQLGNGEELAERRRQGRLFSCFGLGLASPRQAQRATGSFWHFQFLPVKFLPQSPSSSPTWPGTTCCVSHRGLSSGHLRETSMAQSTSPAPLLPRCWTLVVPPLPCGSLTIRDGGFFLHH